MKNFKNIKLNTVEDVKNFAIKNYENGLDIIVECWDDKQIQKLINEGRESVIETFKILLDVSCERTPVEGWDY